MDERRQGVPAGDTPGPPGEGRRLSGRLGRVLLALGTSAALLLVPLAAEWAGRLGAPNYLARTRGFHVFSGTYGWTPRRGSTTVVDGNRVSFDEEGHRSSRRPPGRSGDPRRVVVLGDSIGFGLDVSDEETFSSIMDARGRGIEVLNLAVQGYGPDQELLVLLHDGLRQEPDVVILAFCLSNDFADAVLSVSLYDGWTPKPRFRLAGDRLVLDDSSLRRPASQRVAQWLSDHSHVFNRLVGRPVEREAPPGEVHWRERKHAALRDEGEVLRLTLALVARMDEVCRQRGITLLVAAFPSRASYERKPWLAERFLESLSARSIAVVDMAAQFRALGLLPEAIQLDDIGHLNPRGHAAAAAILEVEVARAVAARAQRQD